MAITQTPLEMTQGSTFSIVVRWANEDLSNYNFTMQLRRTYASNTASEVLSTANGEISVTEDTSKLLIELSPERTKALFVDYTNTSKPPKTTYVYDLEYVDPTGYADKLLSGTVTVYGEVTR